MGCNSENNNYEPHSAWVVFVGEADLKYLNILKEGFRHCFLIMQDEKGWIILDPLSPYIELMNLPLEKDFDLVGWLEKHGHTVVKAPILSRQSKKAAPLEILTCVSVVKRFLGIHNRFIITPYQLYKHLIKGAPQNGQN